MRKFLSVAVGAAALLTGAPALAQQQEFGTAMDLVFSADRLFGITFSRVSDEDPGCPGPDDDCHRDWTHFGLGWRGRGLQTPFEVPRFAFDIFVIDSLSVGGSIGYASYDYEDDPGDGEDEYSEFIFSPRVGYVIMFSDVFGFWPRGGFTYHSRSHDDGQDDNGFAFTAEAAFVVVPTDHFGFWFGPTFDIDFTGEAEAGNADWDRRYRTIGLVNVGLFGYL